MQLYLYIYIHSVLGVANISTLAFSYIYMYIYILPFFWGGGGRGVDIYMTNMRLAMHNRISSVGVIGTYNNDQVIFRYVVISRALWVSSVSHSHTLHSHRIYVWHLDGLESYSIQVPYIHTVGMQRVAG